MKAPLHIQDNGIRLFGVHMPLPFPGAYQVLFLSLFAALVVFPLLQEMPVLGSLARIFTALLLVAGALASSTTRRQFLTTMALAMIGITAAMWPVTSLTVDAATKLYAAAFLGYVIYVILHDVVIASRRVNAALIYGALCVYQLLGLLFAYLFAVLHLLDAGALAGLGDPVAGVFVLEDYAYFSFVTLTTLGYGDVAPVSPMARTVAYTEAVVGQIFLTVIVARVMALYIMDTRQD